MESFWFIYSGFIFSLDILVCKGIILLQFFSWFPSLQIHSFLETILVNLAGITQIHFLRQPSNNLVEGTRKFKQISIQLSTQLKNKLSIADFSQEAI